MWLDARTNREEQPRRGLLTADKGRFAVSVASGLCGEVIPSPQSDFLEDFLFGKFQRDDSSIARNARAPGPESIGVWFPWRAPSRQRLCTKSANTSTVYWWARRWSHWRDGIFAQLERGPLDWTPLEEIGRALP